MNVNRLLKFATLYHSLAAKEQLPENSKDLSVVLKNIESLETYNARKKYAEQNLKHLSSGSARIIYLTKNNTVIKLAKNDRGLAQNKAEAKIKGSSKFINKITKHAKEYSWIEAPYLKELTENQFKKMTKISFNDFGESIRYALKEISGNTHKKKPSNFDKVAESNLFKNIAEIGKKNHLMGGDIARISSWKTDGDHPILVDLGLNKSVYEEFYESSSS